MRNDVKVVRGLAVAVVALFLVGGAVFAADGFMRSPAGVTENGISPRETAEPTETAEPADTAEPEQTAEPAETAEPGETAEPEETAEPAETAEPTETADDHGADSGH